MAVPGFFRRQGIRFVEYCKTLYNDYSTVTRETVAGMREKPLKAGVVLSFLGGLGYAYHTNPSEVDLLNELAERRQTMALLPNPIHRPATDAALRQRTRLLNMDALSHYDLFFLSLLVKHDHDGRAKIYHTQDKNLKEWPWQELRRNIVDVGFLGRWFWLERAFEDFDINTDEFPVEEETKTSS